LGENFVLLELEEPFVASSARPGQFVMVRPFGVLFDPLLPRPFAVMQVSGEHFSLLFEIVGRGTMLLSRLEVGDVVSVLGPLGRGFSLDTSFALLVAGGRGLVPLVFLAQELKRRKTPFLFFLGVRGRGDLALLHVFEGIPEILWACEEETGGFCGTVLELVEEWKKRASLQEVAKIYACGPEGMLRKLSEVFPEKEENIEVSLETKMGCGFGACLGCAVPRRGGGYWHACSDGPVFRYAEVIL
jgi:dihydroorotate dehydrogenase electron transfer subunit